MKKILPLLSLMFCIPLFLFSQRSLKWDLPPVEPSIFAEGLISTMFNERDFALSPDGNEIFFTLQAPAGGFQTIIYIRKDSKGKWTEPEVAGFGGRFNDLEPAFSPDGKKLYFSSNRPIQGDSSKDYDIWFVTRTNGKWSEPQNMGSPVNTAANEYYPSITKSGNLYFTASYERAKREDIYISKFENGNYSKPVALDSGVNSGFDEFNAFISPEEDFIIFSSQGRKDDRGGADLYMSLRKPDGSWGPARNLAMLNSNRIDYCPFVTPDRKILFFTSNKHTVPSKHAGSAAKYSELSRLYTQPQNGTGNIYWVSFEKLMEE